MRSRAISQALVALILIAIAISVTTIVLLVINKTTQYFAPKGGYIIIENVKISGNTATLYIRNMGQDTLTITSIIITNTTQTITPTTNPTLPITLPPGARSTISALINGNFVNGQQYTFTLTYQGKMAGSVAYSLLASGNINAPNNPSNPTGWATPIDITEKSGQTLTNYQVKIGLDSTWDGWSRVSSDGSDIYFTDSSGNPLYFWFESWDYGNKKAIIWVKVPSIPASSTVRIYLHYAGANPYSSYRDVSNTFIPNQIYVMEGSCTDATYCGYMDNHAEADYIRVNYPPNIYTGYTDKIDWGSVYDKSSFGSSVRDTFYQRFRFLFVAPVSGTWTFSISSDDGSELVIQYTDAYGNNYDHAVVGHVIIASWYGGHPVDYSIPTQYQGSITLSAGQGIWLEYLQEEWYGYEGARVMVKDLRDNTWKILTTSNFNGYIFARKYTSPEPSVTINPSIQI